MGLRDRFPFWFPIRKFDDPVGLHKNFRYLEDFMRALWDGSGAAVPTYLVAASDARQGIKDVADFVCDGTADEVQIQAANDLIDGTTLSAGRLVLSAGTFNIEADSADGIALNTGVELVGMGPHATFLTGVSGNASYSVVNAASTIQIRDMYIEAVSSGRGVAANGGASALISNVWINAAGPHIYHNASGTLQVENCLLNGAGSGYVGVSSGQGFVVGNVINVGQHGISVTGGLDGIYVDNHITASTGAGNTYDNIILAGNSDRNVISNNKLVSGGTNVRYGVNISAATCNNNLVDDNYLSGTFGTAEYNDSGTGTKFGVEGDKWKLGIDSGRTSNTFIRWDGTDFVLGGPVVVDQASTSGAVPVITLDQADVDEDFFKFTGTSDTSADRALVDAVDFSTPGAIVGWLKINVEDVQATNPITDGDYYIPFYAVPTT